MRTEVKFTSADYQKLLRCLSILKDTCNDVDIKEGLICQRLNDHSCIMQLDLKGILNNISIPFTTLKQTLDLIKCFAKQDEIFLSIEDESYMLYDKYTTLKFQKPFENYIDNKFIPEEEMTSIFNLTEDNLVITCDLNKIITDRMKSVISGFSINSIQINFEDDSYSIVARSHATDKEAKFLTSKLNHKFDIPSFTRFVYVPFVVDHDDNLKLSVYRNDDICMAKIDTKIDDVNLCILTRSTLRPIEDQE